MADARRPQAALLDRDGIPSIVCTNQSGIARGAIRLEQYRAVRLRLDELLAAEGAALLDTFSCPHHPDITGPCDCRKPEAGLYQRAAALHHLDLSRCLFVGDRYRDVAASTVFRGRGIFVESRASPPEDRARAEAEGMRMASTLLDGVRPVLEALR